MLAISRLINGLMSFSSCTKWNSRKRKHSTIVICSENGLVQFDYKKQFKRCAVIFLNHYKKTRCTLVAFNHYWMHALLQKLFTRITVHIQTYIIQNKSPTP